jgi:hypothetical protein
MTAETRGYCIIVDSLEFQLKELKNRSGTRVDAQRLEGIFTKLKFKAIVKSDLTGYEMHKFFDDISKKPELSQHDCLVTIILSHGKEDGIICCTNFKITENGFIKDKDVIDKFNHDNCRDLIGKPKLFFMSCCRGDKYDEYKTDSDRESDDRPSDTFVGYGTHTGFKNKCFQNIVLSSNIAFLCIS